jgi:hypothetical protein
MSDPSEAHTASIRRQLVNAKRLLASLEEKGAMHTTATLPPELQVSLEDQRAKVDTLEKWLAGEAPTLELKEGPAWSGDRSIREIMDYLSLYCEPSLVDAVVRQVILADVHRKSFQWDLTLRPNKVLSVPSDEVVTATIRNSYQQIAASHITQNTMRCNAVYHIPSQLSSRGRLDRMNIEVENQPAASHTGKALERYVERNAYGTFYRVPYVLQRGSAANIAADVTVFHPARSEEILVTYQPCTDYTATVHLPTEAADRFQLRVEYWHPSRSMEWSPDEVSTRDGFEVSTYRITEPLMPYQGLRVAWHYT